jgi:hypothetical protein
VGVNKSNWLYKKKTKPKKQTNKTKCLIKEGEEGRPLMILLERKMKQVSLP